MGTLVVSDVDGENGVDEVNARKISVSNPVAYQLVRVEGNGRLVPATDDEAMEVEHLLEDDKRKMPCVEAIRCTGGSIDEMLSPKKYDAKDSQVVSVMSQSKNAKDDLPSLDASLEEGRLRLSCESLNHTPEKSLKPSVEYMDDCANFSQASSDKLQRVNDSLENASAPTGLNDSCNSQSGTLSDLANEPTINRTAASETCTNSQPDFSILKGEICLDDLSINELQGVFRATFGRETSVKDKLWLKRRIAMGLMNSCDVPTTNFVIKENKIIHEEVRESSGMVHKDFIGTGDLPAMQATAVINYNQIESSLNFTKEIGENQAISGSTPTKPQFGWDTGDENLQMEHFSVKRARKPTRRYIEELSDVETRESTSRLAPSVKDSGLDQSFTKSRIRPVRDIASRSTTFVMRRDSLGGFDIRIPYVSRVRRGRPRKNFMSFLSFVNNERERSATETSISEERVPSLGQIDSAEDNSDNSADAVASPKGGPKRKHHRAWTLCEVQKLVDGVARYGVGKWSEIRRLAFASYSYRTSVDLKDKWRNLLKASFVQGSTNHADRGSRYNSIPIPKHVLLRVRELAEMQSGIEFGLDIFTSDAGSIQQGKGSGFL